jgi:hypothetical protein
MNATTGWRSGEDFSAKISGGTDVEEFPEETISVALMY